MIYMFLQRSFGRGSLGGVRFERMSVVGPLSSASMNFWMQSERSREARLAIKGKPQFCCLIQGWFLFTARVCRGGERVKILPPKGQQMPIFKLGPHWPVLQKSVLIICSLVTKASSLGVALETRLLYWMGETTLAGEDMA